MFVLNLKLTFDFESMHSLADKNQGKSDYSVTQNKKLGKRV